MHKNLLITTINEKILKLNSKGKSVIFFVTGASSSGKSVISKELMKELNFSMCISLGVISKIIRYFHPEIVHENFEDNKSSEANRYFKEILENLITYYDTKGTNVIIEGVQIDTEKFTKNPHATSGVILTVDPEILANRGNKPETHFKRTAQKKDLDVTHKSTYKFREIENSGVLTNTIYEILEFLNASLDFEILQTEIKKD